jgi:hypothetical protein
MPVSLERSFVFVHIPKTGGTSVTEALRAAAIKLALVGPSTPEQRDTWRIKDAWLHHILGADLQRLMGATAWERCFRFAFVRNPWDRLVSIYHFHRSLAASGKDFRGNWPEWPEIAARMAATGNFGEWIKTGIYARPQLDWVADRDGRLLVEFVGRFEQIERDFAHVQHRIGVTAPLPHLLRTEHRPYREYYDSETQGLVARHYRRDIDAFGYEF